MDMDTSDSDKCTDRPANNRTGKPTNGQYKPVTVTRRRRRSSDAVGIGNTGRLLLDQIVPNVTCEIVYIRSEQHTNRQLRKRLFACELPS